MALVVMVVVAVFVVVAAAVVVLTTLSGSPKTFADDTNVRMKPFVSGARDLRAA